MFLRDRIDNPEEVIRTMEYSLSVVLKNDEEYDINDFPEKLFKVIPRRKYLYSVIKCYVSDDYDDFNKILKFISDNKFQICDDIILRNLSLRNGIKHNIDYYEVYVPVK